MLPGQLVEIKTKSGIFNGTVLTVLPDSISLKLLSGYNIVLKKNDFESFKVIEEKKPSKSNGNHKLEFKSGLPVISILMMGGTIASRVDYETGAVKTYFEPQDLVLMFPELSKLANFKTRVIGKILSEDIRFDHYVKMGLEIKKEIEAGGIKGIIIPHGTDTMHYSSAALAFIFENLFVPIILVGAQRSSDRGSSDAAQNLLAAVQFITKSDFKGIGICMHENSSDETCIILPATKTRKMHTSRRDAFRPINSNPIARVFPYQEKIELLSGYSNEPVAGKLVVKPKFEEKVGIIKARPNMHWQEFDFFRKNKYKGLVIEGTGLGGAPVGVPDEISKPNKKIFDAIKKLVKSGCVVVMSSQCIYGGVKMNVYQGGVFLSETGVISCSDMTTETAYVKLSWLLGNFSVQKARELMAENLRGEINARIQMDFFPPRLD